MTSLLDNARRLVDETTERVQGQYARDVGKRRDELVTPALVLDIAAAQRNIDRMAQRLRPMPAEISPHVKAHKSPELARRQMAAGAIGISTATVWEAVVMASSGIDNLFVVNTIAGPEKIHALAELARDHHVRTATDDAINADTLAEAACSAESVLGVMVEVDTGMDRCGVDTADEALDLARHIIGLRGLRFDGLTGYEGHCSRTPEDDLRLERHSRAMSFLVDVAALLETNGIPCRILSAGGTATWEWTAGYPGINEIQAGTYVVMDNFHKQMAPGFEHSLTVQTRVISVRPDRVVVDVGNKSMGAGDLATIKGYPYLPLRFSDEHGTFVTPVRADLNVGDSVQLIPGYSASTVNWYDAYHVVNEEDVVIDVWPVIPRGPGYLGLVG
jgi:D-serine deaminase-like pyridoxal phosphate-dependent protein